MINPTVMTPHSQPVELCRSPAPLTRERCFTRNRQHPATQPREPLHTSIRLLGSFRVGCLREAAVCVQVAGGEHGSVVHPVERPAATAVSAGIRGHHSRDTAATVQRQQQYGTSDSSERSLTLFSTWCTAEVASPEPWR